jgi:hypothetical protein
MNKSSQYDSVFVFIAPVSHLYDSVASNAGTGIRPPYEIYLIITQIGRENKFSAEILRPAILR